MDIINIIEEPEKNIIPDDMDENLTENIVNQEITFDRYTKLIKLMGLNENINYPINIIIAGIIELYTNGNSIVNKYHKNIKFRNDPVSTQIFTCITGHGTPYTVSQKDISRSIRRLQRNYLYSNIMKTDTSKIMNKNDNLLGFNYENLRWNPLESYVL